MKLSHRLLLESPQQSRAQGTWL